MALLLISIFVGLCLFVVGVQVYAIFKEVSNSFKKDCQERMYEDFFCLCDQPEINGAECKQCGKIINEQQTYD